MTGQSGHSNGESIHYIHWKARSNFDQALLICQRQLSRVDLDEVRDWCVGGGGLAAFEELEARLDEV